MLPWESHRTRRGERARRRPVLAPLEALEGRELLAYSPLGVSLPDLTVSGFAAPVASWGGQLAVSLNVSNLGSSTFPEPLGLTTGAASTANAPGSQVAVFLSPRPHNTRGAVELGVVNVPAIGQNGSTQVNGVVPLPARPPGFPGAGGRVFVVFQVDPNKTLLENDRTNNVARAAQPVRIVPAATDVRVIGLDVPPVMQPGDVIAPFIKVANYGTIDVSQQGPLEVDLVASTDNRLSPDDTIIARYALTSLAPQSQAPARRLVVGDVNVVDPNNVQTLSATLTGAKTVTLPGQPGVYNLGVIVAPLGQAPALESMGRVHGLHRRFRGDVVLSQIRPVGPPIAGLPPAGVVSAPNSTGNAFPIPSNGRIHLLTARQLLPASQFPQG